MGSFSKLYLFICAVASVVALGACSARESAQNSVGIAHTSSGILGGSPVDETESVAAVTIKVVLRPGNYERTCTGTLIGSTYAITAAHCVNENPAPKEIVLFDGTIIGIRQVIVHPKFNSNTAENRFDFAILKLSKRVETFAQLPTDRTSINPGDEATIAGFGSHLPDDEGYGTLYSLPVSVDPGYSNTEFKVFEGPGVGACNGDSGGPLYQLRGSSVILWGVDSIEGPDSADGSCGTSEIYSNVQSVLRWVAQSTQR